MRELWRKDKDEESVCFDCPLAECNDHHPNCQIRMNREAIRKAKPLNRINAQVKEGFKQGLVGCEIAKKLGITEISVHYRANRMGISKPTKLENFGGDANEQNGH